jgi:hypothetical protein
MFFLHIVENAVAVDIAASRLGDFLISSTASC